MSRQAQHRRSPNSAGRQSPPFVVRNAVQAALAAEDACRGIWRAEDFHAGHPDQAALDAARRARWEALTANWRRVLHFDPAHLLALVHLGGLLEQMGLAEDALAVCRQAAEVQAARQPGTEGPLLNAVGFLLTRLGRHDEAEAVTRRQLALLDAEPSLPAAGPQAAGRLTLRASACERLGRHTDALAAAAAAMRAEENDETHRTLGRALLRLGHRELGHRVWAGRGRSLEEFLGSDARWWDGEPLGGSEGMRGKEVLGGKRLRLCSWEGLGDAVQHARYLPPLLNDPAHAGASVLLVAHEEAARLLQSLDTLCPPGTLTVLPWSQHRAAHLASVAAGGKSDAWDRNAPLDDLPAYFGPDFGDAVPLPGGYLRADPADVNRLREVLDAPHPNSRVHSSGPGRPLRVGLVWRGSPVHLNDGNRSLPLSALAPLFDLPGIQYVSLQKGAAAEAEADIFNQAQCSRRLVCLGPSLHDLADTAAAMSLLDLVISVDSSPLHVAGALGVPVWGLMAEPADWRWEVGREDSAWYSSLRLFRQRTPGEWADVLRRVAAALKAHSEPPGVG